MNLLLEAGDGKDLVSGGAGLIRPACFTRLLCGITPDPVDALQLLLDRVTDYDKSVGRDAFLAACSRGSYRCLEALLRAWSPAIENADEGKGTDKDDDDDNLQEAEIECGLSDKDTNEENKYRNTPIVRATKSTDERALQLLLTHGYGKKEGHVRAALLRACSYCNVEVVRAIVSADGFKLSRWPQGDSFVRAILRHEASESKLYDAQAIFELLLAHGLDVNTTKIECQHFLVSTCEFAPVALLNTILSRAKKLPQASMITTAAEIALHCSDSYNICDYNVPDTIATLRAAGADTDREFARLCAKGKSADSKAVTAQLNILIRSGANVNARKKDKPVIYLLAANHYDPVLVSLMLQGGARFDEEALVKCVPKQSKAELRSLIAHFRVAL